MLRFTKGVMITLGFDSEYDQVKQTEFRLPKEKAVAINNNFDNMVEKIVINSFEAIPFNEGDYQHEGVWICGKCNTPKQKIFSIGERVFNPMCLCKCEAEKQAEIERRKEETEQKARSDYLRKDIPFALWTSTFENAEQSKHIIKAEKYCSNHQKALNENIGIIFWGNIGTGKTFTALCIANRLVDMGVKVKVTSFPQILNDLQNSKERKEYITELNSADFLFIDDLGVERDTPYALEIIFYVIDERYKTQKPLIVTTNLDVQKMKSEQITDHKRIYDRILEMCIPILVEGESRRDKIAKGKTSIAQDIFS